MSTSVTVSTDHNWPCKHKYTVTIEDSRSDLNADEMHDLIYPALLALQYSPDTVKDLREEVNEDMAREARSNDYKARHQEEE